MSRQGQPIYVSPHVNTIKLMADSIICQSGGNESMKEVFYGDGGFEEEL
ncbi:MAG: hypothetical protein MJY62_01410 [Bacteroidales bacterium]|nr:hypothetical protein [Bacteroidales bacterium]